MEKDISVFENEGLEALVSEKGLSETWYEVFDVLADWEIARIRKRNLFLDKVRYKVFLSFPTAVRVSEDRIMNQYAPDELDTIDRFRIRKQAEVNADANFEELCEVGNIRYGTVVLEMMVMDVTVTKESLKARLMCPFGVRYRTVFAGFCEEEGTL